jgi:hypothetical protein
MFLFRYILKYWLVMMISKGMILMNWEFLTEFSWRYLKLVSLLDHVEHKEGHDGKHDLNDQEDHEQLAEAGEEAEDLLLDVLNVYV